RGEKQYRRALYVYWKRGSPYPSMLNFDAVPRDSCTVTRATTTTPLQALTLLNDPGAGPGPSQPPRLRRVRQDAWPTDAQGSRGARPRPRSQKAGARRQAARLWIPPLHLAGPERK